MKTLRFFCLELSRLIRCRTTWLVSFLTILSPIIGILWYHPTASTTLGRCLANPTLAGGIAGGILFAFLTIYEWDRVRRGRMETLTNAILSPLTASFIRLAAILALAVLTLGITMLFWLPYTIKIAGTVFGGLTYILCYVIFMGMAMPLAILIASAAYQFTGRFDLAAVFFGVMAGMSLTVWSDQWQLCWLNPCVWAISDDFSNFRIFRSVWYMRMTWLLGLAGIWGFSYLCIRRYGKGLIGSLLYSAQRLYRPFLSLGLITCCALLYFMQPFLDDSNPDTSLMSFYQMPYLENVFCLKRTADVYPNVSNGSVSGTASYKIQNMSGQEQKAVFGINPGYKITSVQVNGQDVSFSVGDYQETNMALLEITLSSEEKQELVVEYKGFPREWNISASHQGNLEISEDYLCLENQNLAPYLLNMGAPEGEMLSALIDITVPENMTVLPFGLPEAEKKSKNGDGTATWHYEDIGGSGIVYAGDYVQEEIEAGGIPIRFYYGRKHQNVMKEAKAADVVRTVVDYCTEHYGFPQFFSLGSLKLIQSRVAGGGYAVPGASLVDEQDFTVENLSNTSKGAASGEVILHEMAHQWWGLGVMFDPAENDLWSSEGLTVYTTYRIVKELYGEEYAQKYYVEEWKKTVDDYYLNFYVRNPEYLAALPDEKQLDISNSLLGVRQYNEMPLKILKAEELVGGEEKMDQILYDLFNRELDPMYPYLTYQDFLDACGLTEEELNLVQDF